MKLLGKDVTFSFQSVGPLYYGKTRKVGSSYEVVINTDAPEVRQKVALVHEGLHIIGSWEAGYDTNRHRACHYLACAILSGWKAKDLKLSITQVELDEFISTLASVWNNRNSGTVISTPVAASTVPPTTETTTPTPTTTTTASPGSTFSRVGQVITFPSGGSVTLQQDGILADLRGLTSSQILDNMIWMKKNPTMVAEPYNTLILKYLNNSYSSSLKDEFYDQLAEKVLNDDENSF